MPERGGSFRGGATISRGPSIGRVGGAEARFSSVITGGPRVSIARSVGATRVPGVEGRLATPLRPITFPGNSGERSASSFNRSRLTNISIIPSNPQTASGRDFIRGLGEFTATAPVREGPARIGSLRRFETPATGSINPQSRREFSASPRAHVPIGGRAPEITGRPPVSLENNPPITTGPVSRPEIGRAKPVDSNRKVSDRKEQTARDIARIQDQLRVQTVSEGRRLSGSSDTSSVARPHPATLQREQVLPRDVQNFGSNAKNKLINRLVKSKERKAGDVTNNTAVNETKDKSARLSIKQRVQRIKQSISFAAARVRAGGAVDLDELLGRKKKKEAAQAQGSSTKISLRPDMEQPDPKVAVALETLAIYDTQPVAVTVSQPISKPLGVDVSEQVKPDLAVQSAIEIVSAAIAVQPQSVASAVEQKSVPNEVLTQQKTPASRAKSVPSQERVREEPGQDKGNYIISRPTQNHRVTAGRDGIWLSFTGTPQEKIEAEEILARVKKPTLKTTSPVLIAVGAGQAVESGVADPTDWAWREDFAKSGPVTQSEAEGILVYAVESHQAIARGPGNPRASKKQVEAVLGNVPHEDEMANLPS